MVESFGVRPVTSLDRGDHEVGERRPARSRTRRRSTAPSRYASGSGCRQALVARSLDQLLAATPGVWLSLKRMLKRARASRRDDVDGRVADIDRGELEVRGSNCAVPSSSGSSMSAAISVDEPAHRIVGAVRIGDVALLAGDDQRAVQRAAAADLDACRRARRHCSARRARSGRTSRRAPPPIQQLDGAVDGDAFLVAGDQERDRALAACRRSRRDNRAPPRRCRRCRPSCRRRRGRTACRP